ncbi:MAG: hypothetical protein RQ741_14515 [Wenzhouxiangellaceae bacterium]|nr:hypothetical protein [Wenzhouxiangellaceae bacterium]
MFLKKLLLILVLLASCSALAQMENEPRHGSPIEKIYCTEWNDLPNALKYYIGLAIDALVFNDDNVDVRLENGLAESYARDELVALETERDSAVCQALNERYWTLIGSRAFDGTRPAAIAMHFRLRDRYVTFIRSYTDAEFRNGQPPPPVPGIAATLIFDKNLNLVGRV